MPGKNKFDQIYPCHSAAAAVKIDGRLTDPAWRQAEILDFFVPVSHKAAVSRTEGRILWDRQYLYVAFKAYDRDIWGYFTKRDSPTCQEDVLEIFIKPDLRQAEYYNFEINALGTVYDARNACGPAGGAAPRGRRWNCKGLKVAVQIKGTLNNWQDEDEYWQLEVVIPFAALPALRGQPPGPGAVWQFHLARYDYSVYLQAGVELSSCARLPRVDFHHAAAWRRMQFLR